MILVGILQFTVHGETRPVKLVVKFQSSQVRCHIFSPDVIEWGENQSQCQEFNWKYFYFYTEVIIIYCTVRKTHNISFKWHFVFETITRDDFN
jgi:hypothetical protein